MAPDEPATQLTDPPEGFYNPGLEARIENDFTYHAPTIGSAATFAAMRAQAKEFALAIVRHTPAGREQSLALTKLEEVVFWANAAIARVPHAQAPEVPHG